MSRCVNWCAPTSRDTLFWRLAAGFDLEGTTGKLAQPDGTSSPSRGWRAQRSRSRPPMNAVTCRLAQRAVHRMPLDSAGQDQEHCLSGAPPRTRPDQRIRAWKRAAPVRRDRPAIEHRPHMALTERFGSSGWVPRNEGTRSPEPCAQVRILLGAQVEAIFSNTRESACAAVCATRISGGDVLNLRLSYRTAKGCTSPGLLPSDSRNIDGTAWRIRLAQRLRRGSLQLRGDRDSFTVV
jgi:hypothetical protein